jgi:cytochrome c peroxidase
MKSSVNRLSVSSVVALGLATVGCATDSGSARFGASHRPSYQRGVATLANAVRAAQDPARLFEKETFGGNGRTCATCHRRGDGFSTTPASAQTRFSADPTDPLFRPSDSDDGAGKRYTRLLTHATIRVRIPLKCPNIWLEDDPAATSVVVNRAIPGLLDMPALDAVVMSDGRVANLEEQALAAIHDHVDPHVEPEANDLRQIAAFEVTDRFFSSEILRNFARGGSTPDLPPGGTAEEILGRVHFLPNGACGRCHSGPMLNTTSATAVIGPNRRFANTRTGELVPNQRINPFVRWHVINNDGSERVFSAFADPGRILISCRREDLTNFRIRSLRNVKNTAPYFHDNSAKTLEDVVAHYKEYLGFRNVPMSDQDFADILAYLKLL